MTRRRIFSFTASVVIVLVLGVLGWETYFNMGALVPGTNVFRTRFDSAHGMADTTGTFFAGIGRVTVRCWSPGVIKRTKFFDIFLDYPGTIKDMSVQSVQLQAGEFKTKYDAVTGINQESSVHLWINGIPREELRKIVSANQAVFVAGGGNTFTLDSEQLAQIRQLIVYTDSLPLFDFPPNAEDK